MGSHRAALRAGSDPGERPPPVVRVVGRQTGQVRLKVVEQADRTTLEGLVEQATTPGTTVDTDEWSGSDHPPEWNRDHSTVCHTPGQRGWARDEGGWRWDPGGPQQHDGRDLDRCSEFPPSLPGVSKHSIDKYIVVFV